MVKKQIDDKEITRRLYILLVHVYIFYFSWSTAFGNKLWWQIPVIHREIALQKKYWIRHHQLHRVFYRCPSRVCTFLRESCHAAAKFAAETMSCDVRRAHCLTSTRWWQFIITVGAAIARNLHHVLQFTSSLSLSPSIRPVLSRPIRFAFHLRCPRAKHGAGV